MKLEKIIGLPNKCCRRAPKALPPSSPNVCIIKPHIASKIAYIYKIPRKCLQILMRRQVSKLLFPHFSGPGQYQTDESLGRNQKSKSFQRNAPSYTFRPKMNKTKNKRYIVSDNGEVIEQLALLKHSPGVGTYHMRPESLNTHILRRSSINLGVGKFSKGERSQVQKRSTNVLI